MNRVFFVPACFGLLAGAAAAQAPEPAPSAASVPAKSAERPALNLKLEEPARSEPRVTFGPREGTTEQRPVDALLPSLGGNPSTAYERPAKGSAPASPYPKDVTPGR